MLVETEDFYIFIFLYKNLAISFSYQFFLQILSIDIASELPPAISLAYESPERDIMKIPPRNRNDRLVSRSLLIYSYIFAGSIITFGCILAYLSVYL